MQKNALIIDDDKISRIIHAGLLRSLGFIIIEAENGKVGLDKFCLHQSSLDLILMDYNMPGMDGIAITRKIRTIENPHKRVPVIGITADVSPAIKAACLAIGMNAVLHKPISPADLEQVLQRFVL